MPSPFVITKPLLIHVFSGGSGSTVVQFQMAFAKMMASTPGAKEHITIKYVSNSDIRENKEGLFTTPELFFAWLSSADLFFMASQGIWLGLVTSPGVNVAGWTVPRIAFNMHTLSNSSSIGFPSGQKLLDPIWNGDKIGYIQELKDLAIPTLCIELSKIRTNGDFRKVAVSVSV